MVGKHGYEAEIEAIGALKVLLLMLIYYPFYLGYLGFFSAIFNIIYFVLFFCCVRNSGQSIAEDAQLYKRVLMDRVAMDV